MKKLFVWAALCIVFLFALSAFDPVASVRVYWETLQGQETPADPIARATIAPIDPLAREDQTDPVRVTLYFRYGSTSYLGQEAYEISVPRDSTMEKAIVSALLAGPDGRHSELSSVFPEGTRVLATTREDDTVTVTLNHAFLNAPAGAPERWQEDDDWAQEVPLRRRLALESIVLALTEDARCHSVQLLVSADDTAEQGARVARSYFYPMESDTTVALEPVTRSESYIFTPRTAALSVLLMWQAKDYSSLYGMLGMNPYTDTAQMPSLDEFVQDAAQSSCSLLSFNVSGGSVSPEGMRATVVIDLQCAGADGERVRMTAMPLSLFRENDNWKVSYGDIAALMERK